MDENFEIEINTAEKIFKWLIENIDFDYDELEKIFNYADSNYNVRIWEN